MRVVVILTAILFVASSAAIVVASLSIESIVITGPVAGLMGLAFGFLAAVARCRLLALANFSLPVLGVAVFLLIFCNHWRPRDAQHPVTVVLLCYELLAAPLWLCGLWSFVRGGSAEPVRWQFPIRTLMLVTLIVATALGVGRAAMGLSAAMLVGVATGFFVLVLCGLALVAVQASAASAPRFEPPLPA
jgi:hypothetical protein